MDEQIASQNLTVRFWGVRGSVPTASATQRRSGGSTSCVELRCGSHVLFLDAGTGLVAAGQQLASEGFTSCDILLSHSHYDHLMGLPFFKLLSQPEAHCTLWSGHLNGLMTTADLISQFMSPPFFPASIAAYPADIHYRDFAPGETFMPRADIRVETAFLSHPGGVVGYAVHFAGRKVAYVTDFEHQVEGSDLPLLELVKNADLLIYDGMYSTEEFPERRGFGHSTWQQGVAVAREAKAKVLALFHHCPWQSDEELDHVEREAAALFGQAFAAREGLLIQL
jgi:phosphoribosyl 1,2-cyclic phosphodiesterase